MTHGLALTQSRNGPPKATRSTSVEAPMIENDGFCIFPAEATVWTGFIALDVSSSALSPVQFSGLTFWGVELTVSQPPKERIGTNPLPAASSDVKRLLKCFYLYDHLGSRTKEATIP
jgi:hypothetical protein